MARRLAAVLLAVAALALLGADAADNTAPQAVLFPNTWHGKIIRQNDLAEPSGIVFHAKRGTLFVVGDEGELAEITTAGKILREKGFDRADFEGIAHDPIRDRLFVVVEDQEALLEIDPANFAIRREFKVEREFGGRRILRPADNEGFEAIAFVPDAARPAGGYLLIANQSYVVDDPDNVSALLEIDIPSDNADPAAPLAVRRVVSLGIPDLAALCFDASTGLLLVVSDAGNLLLEATTDGRIVRYWAFPGDEQEGLALDGDGFLYIAQDLGGVLKLQWHRPAVAPTP